MSVYDRDNIFAKILRGEVPSHKVHEDEHTLAFLDIMPRTLGHTLVIPKVARAQPSRRAGRRALPHDPDGAARRQGRQGRLRGGWHHLVAILRAGGRPSGLPSAFSRPASLRRRRALARAYEYRIERDARSEGREASRRPRRSSRLERGWRPCVKRPSCSPRPNAQIMFGAGAWRSCWPIERPSRLSRVKHDLPHHRPRDLDHHLERGARADPDSSPAPRRVSRAKARSLFASRSQFCSPCAAISRFRSLALGAIWLHRRPDPISAPALRPRHAARLRGFRRAARSRPFAPR